MSSNNEAQRESCRDDSVFSILNVCNYTINGEFSCGKYLRFDIIVHRETGYVNISFLLSVLSGESKKRFAVWEHTEAAETLIKKYKDYKYTLDRVPAFAGIYVHPALLPSIIIWADPASILRVSEIVHGKICEDSA